MTRIHDPNALSIVSLLRQKGYEAYFVGGCVRDMLLNRPISDIDIRRKTGCSIIGFKTAEKEYIINPESATILVENSNLILLGRPEQIQKLHELF